MSGCCSVFCDGPEAVRLKSEIRIARKHYRCSECWSSINPGDKYEYVRGLWEGSYSTYRTCNPCKSARDEYCSGGFYYTEVWEQLGECLGNEVKPKRIRA